jgi:AraC-like DNA-binding protein
MGIIQGIIFGLVIFFNKKYTHKTYLYLAYTVFSLSFSNLQYWFFDSKLYKFYPFLDWLRFPCEFLIIPMFYLFVNNYLEYKVSFKTKLLLLTPFLIDFLCQIFLSLNTLFFNSKLFESNYIYIYLVIEEFSSFFYSSLLIVLTLIIVNKYEFKNNNFDLNKVKAKTRWLKQILLIGLFACIFWLIEIYFMNYNMSKGTSIYYPLWIIISVIIYWLSYVGLFQSSVFSERKEIRKEIVNEISHSSNLKIKKELNGESQDILFKNFESYVHEMYLNPELSLDKVAEKLCVTRNYLSQIINARNITFNDYVNSIRIEKAKDMLKDELFLNYTITAIGLEAGFNSNASFYRSFKKFTNVSPSDYRNFK